MALAAGLVILPNATNPSHVRGQNVNFDGVNPVIIAEAVTGKRYKIRRIELYVPPGYDNTIDWRTGSTIHAGGRAAASAGATQMPYKWEGDVEGAAGEAVSITSFGAGTFQLYAELYLIG